MFEGFQEIIPLPKLRIKQWPPEQNNCNENLEVLVNSVCFGFGFGPGSLVSKTTVNRDKTAIHIEKRQNTIGKMRLVTLSRRVVLGIKIV